jgi:glutathione S-transferase
MLATRGGKVVAKYKLYCVGASGNAYKVALYLACAGLDWEPIGIDFAGGQTRDAGWRDSVNAMGEIPVIEAAGRRLSQSGAILMWLAETTGKFAPASSDERFEAMRWILFDNHRFTGYFAAYRFQNSLIPEPPHPAVLAFLKSRVEAAFAIVERHLSNHSFMLGDRPTIADFSLAGYIYYPPDETGIDIEASFPAIHAWRKRVAALSGWKPPYELMPVGKSLMPSRLARTDHGV